MEKMYFMIIGGQQVGPMGLYDLKNAGLTADTPVWREGLADWVKASTLPELSEVLNASSYGAVPPNYPPRQPQNPYNEAQNYGVQNQYGMQNRYNQPAQGSYNQYGQPGGIEGNGLPIAHTNWLPWAIVGTVLGVLFCMIGMIFGIIAIVNANKANRFYNEGNGMMGDSANSTARTNTIISLVLGAVSIPVAIFVLSDSLATLSALSNL